MSTLEIAILITLGLLLFSLNCLASIRAFRTLKRYSFPFQALIWLVPFFGALFVLAKIRPHRRSAFTPLATNTIGLDPNRRTIQGDPWPTLSQPTQFQNHIRK